jgi:hypothetical protein
MLLVSKFTIEEMKESFTRTPRIAFQSTAFSPSKRQIDSQANFTGAGGFAIDRTSANCFFLMPLTADHSESFNFSV